MKSNFKLPNKPKMKDSKDFYIHSYPFMDENGIISLKHKVHKGSVYNRLALYLWNKECRRIEKEKEDFENKKAQLMEQTKIRITSDHGLDFNHPLRVDNYREGIELYIEDQVIEEQIHIKGGHRDALSTPVRREFGIGRPSTIRIGSVTNSSINAWYMNGVKVNRVNFEGCTLNDLWWDGLEFYNCSFKNCKINIDTFRWVKFKKCSFVDVSFTGDYMRDTTFHKGCTFSNIIISPDQIDGYVSILGERYWHNVCACGIHSAYDKEGNLT